MNKNEVNALVKLIDKYIVHNEAILYENKSSVDNNEIMTIEFKTPDVHGHVIINLKIENSNNNGNGNFVELFMETELGLLKKFSKNILELVKGSIGFKASLNKGVD